VAVAVAQLTTLDQQVDQVVEQVSAHLQAEQLRVQQDKVIQAVTLRALFQTTIQAAAVELAQLVELVEQTAAQVAWA
jgi:hypothetical protein